MKKMIIRDMTVNEISTVDVPAVKGATAVILKSFTAALRKNAAEVAAGEAEPQYKAAEYADALIVRAGEIALEKGCTPGKALLDHSGTDPVIIELAKGERAAEMAAMRSKQSAVFEKSAQWS